jgi:run domain Beclin-1 interacting cysteine-rich containing protein
MLLQNFRCAGCSLRVDVKYMKTYRFCNYFGKFFCTSCHGGKKAVMPARVVEKWDFKE